VSTVVAVDVVHPPTVDSGIIGLPVNGTESILSVQSVMSIALQDGIALLIGKDWKNAKKVDCKFGKEGAGERAF